jgi:hypothetical protein
VDGVEDEIDQAELAGRPGGGHVADRHRDVGGAGLVAQLGHHGFRLLDPSHRHALGSQGERDAAGPDGELQGWPVTCRWARKSTVEPRTSGAYMWAADTS